MAKRHGIKGSQRSVVARIEEIVLASSGADAFELVLALVAGRLAERRGAGRRAAGGRAAGGGRVARRADIAKGIDDAAKRWPGLEPSRALDVPDDVLAEVCALLDRAAIDGDAEALDAVFEQLVTRVGKGEKGQFFTPRHVVDWMVRSVAPKRGERVVDPACGSGAFLAHARATPGVEARGSDVDARAVRVARLLAIASRGDPAHIVRADALRREGPREADVIVTNPPFAGDASGAGYEGFEVAALGRAERDALFVERCVEILRPGGRLAIVLPHNKVAARAWRPLRRWLVERARVLAVVSLPRETFLPHTSQKAVVVFAKRRARALAWGDVDGRERVFFAVSERAGKDAAGEPIVRAGGAGGGGEPGEERRGGSGATWRALDHDLDAITGPLGAFLAGEGFTA